MGALLSSYRVMWVYVMFDLPTNTTKERTEARKFREALLNHSFSMVQFSVYARHCLGKEKVLTSINQVKRVLPGGGKVDIVSITDKQFGNIVSFEKKRQKKNKNPGQLVLF